MKFVMGEEDLANAFLLWLRHHRKISTDAAQFKNITFRKDEGKDLICTFDAEESYVCEGCRGYGEGPLPQDKLCPQCRETAAQGEADPNPPPRTDGFA